MSKKTEISAENAQALTQALNGIGSEIGSLRTLEAMITDNEKVNYCGVKASEKITKNLNSQIETFSSITKELSLIQKKISLFSSKLK